ncbi:MAG TPA: hypothetical protein VLL08_08025 [Kineosporiaceae bacterium]|nr:hypothetical protein [Kineosporiaceae bacterium]
MISITRRTTTLIGVGALLASGLTVAALASPTQALEDRCAKLRTAVSGQGDNFEALCLPDEQLAALDDSGAKLAAGAAEGTDNIALLANLPKQAPFDTETSYNSDLAFQGRYAYAGNYNGFTVYDIRNPRAPKIATQVLCPGSQNDVSVLGNLLFLSTDSRRTDDSCASTPSTDGTNYWEGVKIFDISNPANPQYIKAVETDCGSHTHTLIPSKDGRTAYLYVSSYSPSTTLVDCQPPHDKISIIKVPLRTPQSAAVVAEPVLFPDGGYEGDPARSASATSGCHDITAYPSKDIAAGACMGDGVLIDIKDRENPKVFTTVRDTVNFAFWHSATFNNSGTKVVFTDELGGGGGPVCNPTVGPEKGADGIYDIVGEGSARTLEFRSYFKIPRTQANTENCVAHNGSLIPVPGKDIMVQAWYQGGLTVFDFTDSAHPKEIAWFDRGPFNETALVIAGNWSTYWYNGYIYSNEIQRGLDVFKVTDRRLAGAGLTTFPRFNAQTQERFPG